MNKFYEIGEDMYFKDRWLIDGPADYQGRDEREFRRGTVITLRGPLCIPIYKQGVPLDFTFTLSHVPVLSKRIADAVRDLIQSQSQLFPVQIAEYEGFEVLNATAIVDCVDESRSEFTKWTEADERPEKIGDYQMITRLQLSPFKIPSNLHLFRIKGWKIALIVSQAFVDAILPLNPTGVKLELVT